MSSTPGPGTSVVGSLRSDQEGKGAVRMEDAFDARIDALWSALTDPRRLAGWIASVDGDMRIGGRVHARFTSGWDGPGRIDVCDAPRQLVVTMDPDTSDETVIEAALTSVGHRTQVVIEERGIPLDELAAHGAGWQTHLEDLASHLAGRDPGDWHARWTVLRPTYQRLADGLR